MIALARTRKPSPHRRTLAEQYLASTRGRLAAGYALLVALVLVAIVAATYLIVRSQETTQIHDQLVAKTNEKLAASNIARILRQAPEIKDEEESVRTFIVSRDGVLRDADAVVRFPPDRRAVGSVLRTGIPVFTAVPGPTSPLSVYTAPIRLHGTIAGVIQAVTTVRAYSVILQYLLAVSLGIGGVGILLAAVIGFLMADWGLHPVRSAINDQQAFAQNAAHELRAPLTVVRTAAELALRSADPAEMSEALTAIVRQTEHLDAVVGDLRLLAQGDAGRLTLDTAPLDLASLVREVHAELQPAARDRNVQLTLDASGSVVVDGDRHRLSQLILILIDNALQHAGSGIAVEMSLAAHRGKAILTVRDSGAGIEANHLPHVFDRFYRADSARSRAGGAGLGLAIAREIAEAHGGRISVESQPGAGSAFRVTLPSQPGSVRRMSRETSSGATRLS